MGQEVIYYPDGSTETKNHPDPPAPQPNTPGNEYFGKSSLTGGAFLGLLNASLGMTRANRLVNDSHFAGIGKFLTASGVIVNPDDKAGQFLAMMQYVTTTNGDDGQVLVTAQEVSAIKSLWK